MVLIHPPAHGFDDARRFDERIADALADWVERHPCPDRPILATAEGHVYTPRELVDAVAARTPFGRSQLAMYRVVAEARPEIGPEGLIAMIETAATDRPWRPDRS